MEGAVMLARTYRSLDPYDAAVTQLRTYFGQLIQQGSEWTPSRRTRREQQDRTRRKPRRHLPRERTK
jgi:hypothetical protein